MYHRNRLVKPYVRVGYQLRVSMQNNIQELNSITVCLLALYYFCLVDVE